MIKLKNILSEMEQLRMANPNLSSLPRPKNRAEWNIDDWTNYWQELRWEKPYKKPKKPPKSITFRKSSTLNNIQKALKKFLSYK